jgi:hypothetical protein
MHPDPIYPPEVAPEDDSGEEVPLTEMVARIRAAAPGMTELHLNEVGWAVYGAVDEAAQGNYLARAYLLAAEMGAASTCWFNYQDGPFHGQFPPEDDFGLLRYDGSEKPAWNALKTLIMELGALGFSARLPTPAGTHALFFRDARPSRGVTAVWRSSDDAPTSLEVKLATGKGMLVRMDGSAAEVSGDRIAVPLGDDPVLVVELAPKK